jgi:hypothetical protein
MIAVSDLYEAAGRAGLLTDVVVGGLTVQCAFRAPDESVLDGFALNRDYHLEYPSVWLTLTAGDTVEIAGTIYKVREVRQLRDGSEMHASLTRL